MGRFPGNFGRPKCPPPPKKKNYFCHFSVGTASIIRQSYTQNIIKIEVQRNRSQLLEHNIYSKQANPLKVSSIKFYIKTLKLKILPLITVSVLSLRTIGIRKNAVCVIYNSVGSWRFEFPAILLKNCHGPIRLRRRLVAEIEWSVVACLLCF